MEDQNKQPQNHRNSFQFQGEIYSPYPMFSPYIQMFPQDTMQSFTPLMSPLTTPTVNFHQMSLTSPALGPTQEEFEFLAPSAMEQDFAPLTPAQLMQLKDKPASSGSLKPLIPVTPTMRPEDATILAQKSNYQTLVEGYSEQLGIQNVQVKKPSHKEAEQKRRDNLKNHFKIVKQVLPLSRDKNPSKVMILKKARNYILDLQHDRNQRDLHIQVLQEHIKSLESGLVAQGVQVPPVPSFDYKQRPRDSADQESSDDD